MANKIRRHDASEALLDEDFIFRAFLDCLKDDDFQAAVDVLKSYARVNIRVKTTKRAKPKAALYQRFASSKPTIAKSKTALPKVAAKIARRM